MTLFEIYVHEKTKKYRNNRASVSQCHKCKPDACTLDYEKRHSIECTATFLMSEYLFNSIKAFGKICFPSVYASEKIVKHSTPVSVRQEMRDTKEHIVVSDEEVRQFIQNESGMDRLRRMYSLSSKSKLLSIDMCNVLFITSGAFVLGTINPIHAGKFRITLLGKIGQRVKVGLKGAGLMGMWSLSAQSISTYRNKTNPLHFTPGAALLGFIVFARHSLLRSLRVSAISAVIGTAIGALYTAALYYENETQSFQHFAEIKVLMESGEIERPKNS